jgi:serine protease Do
VHGQEELIEKTSGHQPEEPLPIPNPDEEPKGKPGKGEKPKGKPHDRPPPGRRPKPSPLRPELPVPELVKKHFEEKRGYANYYFNKLNQDRVWKAWTAGTNLAGAKGAWTLAGRSEAGDEFRFQLTDDGASLHLRAAETKWSAGDQWGSSLLPAHSGGLLPALYLWRRLAVEGLGRFGEVSYYGTAPLVGHAGLVDVLLGSHKGVDCRFYFDPAAGNLLALEMFPDESSDPCEVYFSDFREEQGRRWPGRIEVRYGDEVFAVLKVKEARVEK